MHTYQFDSYILIGVQIFTWNDTKKNFAWGQEKPKSLDLIRGSRRGLSLPSFNSPKFPQPIFLPTRKLGPTMRTPEEPEEPDGRDECPLRLPWEALAALVGRSPYLSLCWSMALSSAGQREPEGCRTRPPGLGPPQPQPWSLAAPDGCSHSHETSLGHSWPALLPCPRPLQTVWHLSRGGRRWTTCERNRVEGWGCKAHFKSNRIFSNRHFLIVQIDFWRCRAAALF